MKRNKINHTSATLMKTAKIMIRAEGTVRDEITAAQRVGVAVPSLTLHIIVQKRDTLPYSSYHCSKA